MNANENKKHKTFLKICTICGEVITDGNYDFSKTKRGREIFWHKDCYKKEVRA